MDSPLTATNREGKGSVSILGGSVDGCWCGGITRMAGEKNREGEKIYRSERERVREARKEHSHKKKKK
jgi:hypothetical protein